MSQFVCNRYIVGMVSTNCYVFRKEGEKQAVVVDPGAEGMSLADRIRQDKAQVCAILVTHAHFDHIGGIADLKEAFPGAQVYVCEKEKRLCSEPQTNLSTSYGEAITVVPDQWVKDKEHLQIAGFDIQVIETPGHTEGCCCYYLKEENVLFSGDTLFEESVGRTDFPTGSMSLLTRSVKEKLYTLPDDTSVLTGHGGVTTIGHEKKYNMFVL